MTEKNIDIAFTGEYFVPGKSGERIEDDHLQRYIFLSNYVQDLEILDIACGYGYGSEIIMKGGALSYEGVDISKDLIENAKLLYSGKRVKYCNGDIVKYNSNKLFDIICCFETIEHVKDYKGALVNIYSMLKPNGILFISSPNRVVTSPNAKKINDKPSNKFHIHEFTIKELTNELKKVGFITDKNIYGQRLITFNIKNKILKKIINYIFGDTSNNKSPIVSIIEKKIPRYFIILAYKK